MNASARQKIALRESWPFNDRRITSFQVGGAALTEQYFDPWIISLIDRLRPDLWEHFPKQADQSRPGFLEWLFANGIREYRALAEDPVFKAYLNGIDERTGLKRLHALVYVASADLQAAYPLSRGPQAFEDWFERSGADMLGLSHFVAQPIAEIPSFRQQPFGVNLIGYVYGQLGIGEDLRMAARALRAAEVPFTLIDFPPGKDIPQNDRSMEAYVSEQGRYAYNLFCMTALEQGRYYAEYGRKPIQGRYNIGYWPWELAQWPEEWKDLTRLVDEVWVSTQHIYDALAPVSEVPVFVMPMAVEMEEVALFPSLALVRAHFRLPTQATLFCFSFDFNSSIHRKNPQACLNAFLRAFPVGEYSKDRVGLVIKAHKPAQRHAAWEKLKALAAGDDRIHIIEDTLSRADLLALYKACNCFLSLHRAEGFGRSIAEALQLGLHVITTAYSGNMDFCVSPQVDLVRYKLVKVKKDQYPYHRGQVWADADVNHAAELMLNFVRRSEQDVFVSGKASNDSDLSPTREGSLEPVEGLRISSVITSDYGSQAPRGNLLRLHSHAEHGNDASSGRGVIFNQILADGNWPQFSAREVGMRYLARLQEIRRLELEARVKF